MAREEVQKAVDFFVKNAGQRPRDLPRDAVKQAIVKLEEAALGGLPATTILTLAQKIIFVNSYDQITRRRLLNCLIPEGQDFPLQVVPLAVSSAGVKDVSVAWQHAVLSWLEGMVEYGIILSSEPLVHICYTTIFNLASCLTLSALACRLLYQITVREDVTPNRVQALMKLKQKPAFDIPVSYLLRLYHLFRPDMVAGRLADRTVVIRLSPGLKGRLLEARQRLQSGAGELVGVTGKDGVWRAGVERVNVYQRPTPVPQPQFNMYTTTVEEKKGKVIYVTQYQRFHELVQGMEKWESWVWPTNPAAHLACPLLVPLFRPHQVEVQVSLTNWLEVALRTEIIEGIGAPSKERQETLLSAVQELCFTHAASLPVISNFFVELMTKWNQQDHFEKVVRMLEYVSFTSMEVTCETVLRAVARLLTGMPIITWCRVVEALTATACLWVLAAHQQNTNITPDGFDWPQQRGQDGPLAGVLLLTVRLEQLFLMGTLNFRSHPLVIHHILDYYAKVDQYCEDLGLPFAVYPPVVLVLAIIASSDITATHRIGLTLSKIKGRMAALKRMQEEGCEDPLLQETLQNINEVNESILLFLTGVLQGKALSSLWKEKLDPFYPFEFLKEAVAKKDAQKFAAVTHALSYLPFVCGTLAETSGRWTTAKCEEVQDAVLADLRAAGLTGIKECSKTYAKS